MIVTEERILNNPVPERLASLSEYPSGKYLYHSWEHDSYKTDNVQTTSGELIKKCTPKAFIRSAENHNNV